MKLVFESLRLGQQKNTRRSRDKKNKKRGVRSLSRVVVVFLFKAKKNSRTLYYSFARIARENDSLSHGRRIRRRIGGGSADDPYLLQSLKGGHRNNAITSLAFAPQSKRYIFSASTGDGSIMFWHVGGERSGGGGGQGAYALLKNRKRPVRFLGHERDVLALAHTEREGEGGRVASAGLDRSIRVWKATAYVFVRFFLFLSYFFLFVLLFVDRTREEANLCSQNVSHLLFLFKHNREGKSVVLRSAHSGAIRSLQYSDSDRLLLSASDDKLCKLWDASNPSVSPKFKLSLKGHSNWIRQAVITSDGTIACSVSDDKTWRLWDVCAGGVEIDRRKGEDHDVSSSTPRCVALRPSAGTSIAVGDSNGGLRVYDTRSRRKIFESTIDSYVYSHRDAITDVQWHPAGDFLATTSADGSTKIWDFRDQRCAWTLKAHEGSVNCAAFTADGSTFACGGSDGIVTLWKSGFNRSFENVVLAEKQTHDKKYQVENEEEREENKTYTRRRRPPPPPPPTPTTKITTTRPPPFDDGTSFTTTKQKIQPSSSFSSASEYAELAQTLRRAVGQLDVLTQTLALVEARVTMSEDRVQKIARSVSSLAQNAKR